MSDGNRGDPVWTTGRGAEGATARLNLAGFAWRMVVAVLILGVAYLLWRGVHVLLLAFSGLLLAVLLSSLSAWLSQRTGVRYGWALGVVVLGLVVLLVVLGWLLANRLALQITELSQQMPQSVAQIRQYLGERPWGRLLLEQVPQAAETVARSGELSQVTGILSRAGSLAEALIIIIVVGIFGAANPSVYKNGLLHLIPRTQRMRVEQALSVVVLDLRWWLVGQVLLMFMIGGTTAVGLWLMGIPLALTLGVIAGILELVPYVGAWLAAVPAVLVALLRSPGHALAAAAFYLGLHILEGYVLAPLVQRRAVHLPPALALVSQFLLGELQGVLGLFVAAPLTVVAIVFVKMLYVEDALGDESVGGSGESEGRERTESAGAGWGE